MTLELVLSLIGFTLVTSLTPGPNNIMLLASGVNFGFKRTVPHMAGIVCGFAIMTICMGFGLGQIFEVYPFLFFAIKVAGGCYLLFLAYQIANSRSVESAKQVSKPLGFLGAAAFQWVNPKAWVVMSGAITAFTNSETYGRSVLIITFVFVIASIVSTASWTVFGTQLRSFMTNKKYLRPFNITMALLLVISLWPMLR